MSKFFHRFLTRPGSKARSRRGYFRPELVPLEDRANPAQLWVAAPGAMTVLNDVGNNGLGAGDTVRVALPGGQFTDGTFGTNIFSTVESAVAAANANPDAANTIRVGNGTFTLAVPQLNVTKDLNLIGSGQGATTIQAGVNTTTGGAMPLNDSSAAILVNRGVSLNVGSVTLDGGSGSGVDVPVLLKYTGAGGAAPDTSVLSDVRVQNVGTAGGTPLTSGVGVYVANGNVTVSGATLQNVGTDAVLYRGATATGSVLGSTLTGQGMGARVNVGVGVDNAGGVTVRGNTLTGFTGTTGGTNSAGVAVTGSALSAPAVDVEHNQFTGNRLGVSIGSLLSLTGSAVVSNNNFVGGTVAGISSLTSGALGGLQNFYQGNGLNVVGLSSPGVALPAAAAVTSTPPGGSIVSPNGAISGRVTNPTTGAGLPGATVYLDANGNGRLDPAEVAVAADGAGNFAFSGLPVSASGSTYRVALVVPAGGTPGTTAVSVGLNPLQLAVAGVGLSATVPPAGGGGSGGGGGSFPTLPDPGIGAPTGPGRPADGSTLALTAGAAGFGSSPQVVVYNPDGSVRFSFLAFDAGYKGGVRVATGDVNGDGVDDIIVGAGAGAGPHVKVFDGATGALLRSFMAFDTGFKGGVTVAAADLNRDGFADVIVGAATGNSPHVKVFDGATGKETQSYLAFDAGFKGGVNVAAGDIDGDGYNEVVVAAGAGAGPHIKVFGSTGAEKLSFYAFDPGFTGGVSVAVGDADGDGRAEIIAGAGAGADPRVTVFDGKTGNMKRSFLAFDRGFKGGVDVAYDADSGGEIVAGAGTGGQSHINYYDASTGKLKKSFFAWNGSGMSGVHVG